MTTSLAIIAGVILGYAAGLMFLPGGSSLGWIPGRFVAAFVGGLIGWWGASLAGSRSAIAWEGSVVQVSTEDDFARVLALSNDRPVLVDFYADWCPPCRRSAPELNRLAEEGRPVAVVNVDLNRTLARRYEVSAIPTLMVLRDGKVTTRTMGYHAAEDLRPLLAAEPD